MSEFNNTTGQLIRTNVLFICLYVVAIVCFVYEVRFQLAQAGNSDIENTLWISILAFLLFAMAITLKHTIDAGWVLLDIKTFSWRGLHIGIGILCLIWSGFAISASETEHFSSVGLGGICGSQQLYFGLSRLQLCKNGILDYTILIPWKKIESFEWVYEGENECQLKLKLTSRIFLYWPKCPTISMPLEKKERTEALLLKQGVRRT
ncbi:MAG: hypothetical protein HOO93_00070 [Methyloglobulus sp.]|nr:hypothetical protein [Methyloglobulus sp.]